MFLLVSSLFFSTMAALAQVHEDEGATIAGTVSSVDGPIGGLTIILNTAARDGYTRTSNTTTDPEGRYEFKNLTLGGNFLLELRYGDVHHLKPVIAKNETVEANFNITGTVIIRVTDRDGTGVAGLEIQLINKLGSKVANSTTDVDGMGGFSYLDVEEPYMVTFSHRGIPYHRVFRFSNGTSTHVDFKLLAATTSDEEIEVYMHHMVVDVKEDYLSVWEAITYRNMGEDVFNNSWLRIWLPPDAADLSTDIMDCCIQNTGEGILFDPMEPIFPMERYETSLSYRLKIKSGSRVLQKKLDYDTETLYIFIKKTSGIEAESAAELIYEGEKTLGGDEYFVFKGAGLQRGAVVSVRLKGLMSITDILMNKNLLWAAVLLAAPSGFLLYYLRLQKAGEFETEEPDEAQRKPLHPAALPDQEAAERRDEARDMGQRAPQIGGRLTPEEEADLRAEERALEAVLEKIVSDYEGGLLSEGSYSRLVSKYGGRLKRVRERLQRPNGGSTDSEA